MTNNIALSVGGSTLPLPAQIVPLENLERPGGSLGRPIFSWFITVLLLIAVILAAFSIMRGGFKWVRSQGDAKKIEEARTTIVWSIAGLLIAFFSYFIVKYIFYFFHIRIF